MADIENLEVLQQVLKGVVLCLALEMRANLGNLTMTLSAFAETPNLNPAARATLLELAGGLGVMAGAGKSRS